MTADDLRERVAALKWYHTMTLPGGVVTDGIRDGAASLPGLHFPESFADREVLDIGSWDGFYAFEAKRRGARRAVASDSFCWDGDGWGTKDGFLLAREALGLDVDDKNIDVMDLSPERVGTFDDVLFLGVLYHLRDPLTALERVASVTRDRLILETETSLTWVPWPATNIYYGGLLNADPTNFYAPNPAGLKQMLCTVGFRRIKVVFRTSLVSRVHSVLAPGHRKGQSVRMQLRSQRIVIHAWK